MLKLGIIGLSEGNGHPYSWSAIINGYNPVEMQHCPFASIPAYLEKQHFPEAQATGASVTHVWCQDIEQAKHISKCCYIPQVVQHPEEMLLHVDGLLLARDDAENHWHFAKPFLEAGLPVYFDKPLALSLIDAKKILTFEKFPGQVFSCSALAYSPEWQLSTQQKQAVGEILHIEACISKKWPQYGIHLIEPVLNLLPHRGLLQQTTCLTTSDRVLLTALWESAQTAVFHTSGSTKIEPKLRITGSKGEQTLVFTDSFTAFKNALQHFIDISHHKTSPPSHQHLLDCIKLVEAGITQ